MSAKQDVPFATNDEQPSVAPYPVLTGMTFGSDFIVNGVLVKAGTVINFETPGAQRSDLADQLWRLYEGLYGHKKAEGIDPFKTAVNGALEVAKAFRKREAVPSETRATVAPNVDGQNFYELCQQYRHSKELMSHPSLPNTVQTFNNLREYIKTGKLPWPSYEADEAPHRQTGEG